ncbi:MAG: PilZ domain-containing protein [Gammaproteobacteria bacterium]
MELETNISDQDSAFDVTFNSESALYKAYMPFVKRGGLFVHSDTEQKLGQGVTLKIKLPTSNKIYTIVGKIIWITPKAAQNAKLASFGVEFSGESGQCLRVVIEQQLENLLQSNATTGIV